MLRVTKIIGLFDKLEELFHVDKESFYVCRPYLSGKIIITSKRYSYMELKMMDLINYPKGGIEWI